MGIPTSKPDYPDYLDQMMMERERDLEHHYRDKYDALQKDLYRQFQYQQMAAAPAPLAAPKQLSPKDAHDFYTQLEHDGVVIKDRKLLFGEHMTKDLRQVPLAYLVSLGAGTKQLRREVLREIKRRRIVEKLEKS